VISCIACLDPHLVSKISYQLQPDSGSPWPPSLAFILYLLVNKIRVFCARVNETAYSCGRFSIFCGLIFGLLLHSAKSLLKVGIPAQIVKLLLSFLFAVYLLLPPITDVFIIGAFLMLCLHVIC
jgi:hypothetical protein